MSFIEILVQALGIYMAKSGTFRVGSEKVTVTDVDGKPVHLTIPQAMAVLEAVAAGQNGTFQVGNINVVVGPWS